MQIKNELVLLNTVVLLAVLVAAFTHVQALRIVLGLPFFLFIPGYVFIAALFPGKDDLPVGERLILSLAFSLVTVVLIDLVLNYVWAINLTAILTSQAIFIVSCSLATECRRRNLPPEERFSTYLDLSFPWDRKSTKLNRALNGLLILSMLAIIGTLGYTVVNPKVGEHFTEFYILGAEGKANAYPTELTVGQAADVTVGIVNREHEGMSYAVEVLIAGKSVAEFGPIALTHNQTWEEPVEFILQESTGVTRLVNEVYRPDGPYEPGIITVYVDSAKHLSPGDSLWIGREATRIRSVEGLAVTLEEPLREYHSAGTAVTETQKLEFRLYKIRKLDSETGGSTRLSLWLGKEGVISTVANEGASESSYDLRVKIGRDGDQPDDIREDGPVSLASGEEWKQETVFTSPADVRENVEFTLFSDGQRVYHEKASSNYPVLYLWVYVK